MEQAQQQLALVLGGGMAGLAAAEALSKTFGRVLVLERDEPRPVWRQSAVDALTDAHARRGVTQYHQLHALISKGLSTFDEIFGGRYSAAVAAAGGHLVDMSRAVLYLHPGTGTTPWLRPGASRAPLTTALATRHCLEQAARRLVEGNARVELRYNCCVTGLHFADGSSGGGGAVTGVRLADSSVIAADLVIDATGRGSATPRWLAAAGWQRPHTSRVTTVTSYASWLARLDPRIDEQLTQAGVHGLAVLAVPPQPTFGLLLRVEGGAWIASVGGNEGVHPPATDDELVGFARKTLWHPCIGNALAGSTPLTPATRTSQLSSVWRHYESVRLPERLVVLADAICSFSPAYGQGMTVAALEVAALGRLLARRAQAAAAAGSSSGSWQDGLPREFQRAVLPVVQTAWALAAGNDVRWAGTESNEPTKALPARLLEAGAHGYLAAVFKLAATDAAVNEALLRVLHMLDGPQALLQPGVLLRVLLYSIAAGVRAAASGGGGKAGDGGKAARLAAAGSADGGSRQGVDAELLRLLLATPS